MSWLVLVLSLAQLPVEGGGEDAADDGTRIGVLHAAVAAGVTPSGAAPVVDLRVVGLARQISGAEVNLVTLAFAGSAQPRFGVQLADFQEIIFGSLGDRLCAPPVFFVGALCSPRSGVVGVGATLLDVDTAIGVGTNLRLVDANVRVTLPSFAYGDRYQTFRVSLAAGASLDYAASTWLGRGAVGVDALWRLFDQRLELRLSARWRPNLLDFGGDQLAHGELRVAWRVTPRTAAFVYGGGAWNTRPERAIGTMLSRVEVGSGWVGVGFEGIGGLALGGSARP